MGLQHLTVNDVGSLVNKAPVNVVEVNSLSDLPAPSGGKITLSGNTEYRINTSINIGTDYLQVSDGTILSGLSVNISQIIYTGAGGAIRGTDVSFTTHNITYVASTVGAEVFVFSNTGKTKNFVVIECAMVSCDKVGTITGFENVLLNIINYKSNQDGWYLNGATHYFIINQNFDNTNLGTFIDITGGTVYSAIISQNVFHPDGTAVGLNINTGALTVNGFIDILNNSFLGTGTRTSGYSSLNIYINQKGNSGVTNIVESGSTYWNNSVGTMTINQSEGYKKIQSDTSLGANLIIFSHTSPCRLTYTGLETITVSIELHLAVYYVSGSGFVATIGIVKNGTGLNDTPIEGSINGFSVYTSREPVSTSVKGVILNTNDYIEPAIQKIGIGTSTIVIPSINMQITKVG